MLILCHHLDANKSLLQYTKSSTRVQFCHNILYCIVLAELAIRDCVHLYLSYTFLDSKHLNFEFVLHALLSLRTGFALSLSLPLPFQFLSR